MESPHSKSAKKRYEHFWIGTLHHASKKSSENIIQLYCDKFDGNSLSYVGGIADHTSRCRRTEQIVPMERGVCSCAELQVFSSYRGWKEACQETHAISTTWRRKLPSCFSPLQGKVPKEINAILTETLGIYAPSYATVKNWVAQFKRGDFTTCNAPRPGRPKTVTTPEIIDQSHELI